MMYLQLAQWWMMYLQLTQGWTIHKQLTQLKWGQMMKRLLASTLFTDNAGLPEIEKQNILLSNIVRKTNCMFMYFLLKNMMDSLSTFFFNSKQICAWGHTYAWGLICAGWQIFAWGLVCAWELTFDWPSQCDRRPFCHRWKLFNWRPHGGWGVPRRRGGWL